MQKVVVKPRALVFLGDVAVLAEEHNTGVEVGSVGQPGGVRQKEVCSLAISGLVKYFLYVAVQLVSVACVLGAIGVPSSRS